MGLQKAKIYNDGSHYIAIPYEPSPYKRKKKPQEELIEIEEQEKKEENIERAEPVEVDMSGLEEITEELPELDKVIKESKPKTTRVELFKKLYKQTFNMTARQRKSFLIKELSQYFKNHDAVKTFVERRLDMEKRNMIARRVRIMRKVNLNEFNYFVTFTFDSKLHTEDSFRKGLKKCLQNYHTRYSWKYIGVWERGGKGRLHFHGVFDIPNGTMPGELIIKKDYSFKTHRREECVQNTYFNKRFGRSDFEEIDKELMRQGGTMRYLLKYIEKSGEKLVISRGIPTFLVSDIFDDDIVCPIGQEDRKRLLFDDFIAMDDGEILGSIKDKCTKPKMQTAN